MINAIIIRTDGTAEQVELTANLATLSGIVGGYIEAVTGDGGWTAYVNEEGKLDGLPVNELGDLILRALGWRSLPGDVIVGDLVLVGEADADGNDTGLSEAVTAAVLGVTDQVARERA